MIYYVHIKENKADLSAGRGEGERKMKKRMIKKIAKEFLATKKAVFGVYEEECCIASSTRGNPGALPALNHEYEAF